MAERIYPNTQGRGKRVSFHANTDDSDHLAEQGLQLQGVGSYSMLACFRQIVTTIRRINKSYLDFMNLVLDSMLILLSILRVICYLF